MFTKPAPKHSYSRRKFGHDYRSACTYHIIFRKAEGAEPFSRIMGDASILPGQPGCAWAQWLQLGEIIGFSIRGFHDEYPEVAVYCYCVMPDHVHILLRITKPTDRHLGQYMGYLKTTINKAYSLLLERETSCEEIFEAGFTDKVILSNRPLAPLFAYIRQNPHRLAMRRQYPQFFRRVTGIAIGNKSYEAYGNLFLLRNPDKWVVKISRNDSSETVASKCNAAVDEASSGTVLVSPFISPAERQIRRKAEAVGASIILIVHEAFPERFKPAAHDFELCSAGRLLIITLGMEAKTPLTRPLCQQMNELARIIAEEGFAATGNAPSPLRR